VGLRRTIRSPDFPGTKERGMHPWGRRTRSRRASKGTEEVRGKRVKKRGDGGSTTYSYWKRGANLAVEGKDGSPLKGAGSRKVENLRTMERSGTRTTKHGASRRDRDRNKEFVVGDTALCVSRP